MIDNATGKRLLVEHSPQDGFFVRISNANDHYGFDELLDNYFLPYEYRLPEDLKVAGGCEYHFGEAVNIEKLQDIIDEIEVPSDYLVSTEIIYSAPSLLVEKNIEESISFRESSPTFEELGKQFFGAKNTNQLIVLVDENRGPYLRLKHCENLGLFKKLLGQKYRVIWFESAKNESDFFDAEELFFGIAADLVLLQNIFDEMIAFYGLGSRVGH